MLHDLEMVETKARNGCETRISAHYSSSNDIATPGSAIDETVKRSAIARQFLSKDNYIA